MAERRGKRVRAGDTERDAVLDVLQRAYGAGRLDLDEVTERQELVLKARFTDELVDLVDDLPEGQSLPAVRAETGVQEYRSQVPAVPTSPSGLSFTVMSGRSIVLAKGSTGMRDFAWWGGHYIYLDEVMGPGVTVILELNVVMAGHDIFVPPGVRVLDESSALMAGNDIRQSAQGDGSNGTLILRGFAFWGGSDVRLDKKYRR